MDIVRKEAYHIIYKVLKDKQRSEALLEKAAGRLTGRQEKALLFHLVRGILKMVLNLEYIAKQFCEKNKYTNTDIKIKTLLYLGLYQMKYCNGIPAHSVINETVEIAKTLYGKTVSDYVNAVLREYQRRESEHQDTGTQEQSINKDELLKVCGKASEISLTQEKADTADHKTGEWLLYPQDNVQRLSAMYSFPPELISNWLERWNQDDVEKLCQYFNEPPKLSLRVNRIATDANRLKGYFKRKNIELQEVKHTPNILITDKVQETLADVAFDEGYFSIQDASAALTVELLAPQKDESILDLFAGPGGKCTYISELLLNTGQVIAIDKYPYKVKKIKQAIHRLQITNTLIVTTDALKYAPRAAAYDRVLIDVPCSGWGVLQKKPELRWQKNQNMKSILKLQEQALSVGSLFVKPGGYLVYSTCTMNPKENEEQVEKFLQSNKNFRLIDAADFVSKRYTENKMLYTLPHRDNIDGTFAAKMQKKK